MYKFIQSNKKICNGRLLQGFNYKSLFNITTLNGKMEMFIMWDAKIQGSLDPTLTKIYYNDIVSLDV